MRAGSVRTSSIVLSYSHIMPLAVIFSLMWWNENKNDFSSRMCGHLRSFSSPRNALHSRSRSALSSARKASSISALSAGQDRDSESHYTYAGSISTVSRTSSVQ